MTEREAFEAWYDAKQDGRIEPYDVWQAACAWQRERDARLCEQLGRATNGIYERNQECADKIRSNR